MKSVLLVNPPSPIGFISDYLFPPLGLAYIASSLEQSGQCVEILDMNALNLDENHLVSRLSSGTVHIVGFTATTPVINRAIKLCKTVKETDPSIVTIVGGPHVSAIPDQAIESSCVDITVRGEGERAMTEVANDKSLDSVRGIIYRKGEEVIRNPIAPLLDDIDSLPFPARHLLPANRYSTPLIKRKPFTTLLTSRGCPYNCTFCYHFPFGHKFRPRSPKNVIAEVDDLVHNHGIRELDILDDCFTFAPSRTYEICEEIIAAKYDLIWRCSNGIRVDTITKDLLELMHKAGCVHAAFGVESGDPEILSNIRKGVTIDKITRVFKWCRQVGIETTALMMIGNIGENRQTIQRSIEFVNDLDPDYVNWAIAVPFPTTEFHKWVTENGYFLTDNWDDFGHFRKPTFEVPPDLTSDLMVRMYKAAIKAFYLRPRYVMSRLSGLSCFDDLLRGLKNAFEVVKLCR